MNDHSKDEQFWSKIARKYAAYPIQNMEGYLKTLDRTKSYLKSSDHVLELGCGTGSTALLIAPHVAHITATDVAPGMIEIAKEKRAEEGLTNVEFRVAQASEKEAAEMQYDAVLAHNLLHLVPDLDDVLASSASQTKPGGLFISKTVCEPETGRLKFNLLRWVAIPIMQALGKAPQVRFVTSRMLIEKITGAGFEIVETFDQDGMLPSTYIVSRKL